MSTYPLEPYLDSINSISRAEYLHLLKEANDEGRVARALESAIETKEQWGSQQFWTAYSSTLKDEFYIAYRAGYKNYKGE